MSERVLILFNPISGRGQAKRVATEIGQQLSPAVEEVVIAESRDQIRERLAEFDCVVIAGGDGTVMELLPLLEKTQTPFIFAPCGNESLIARSFGFTNNSGGVLERIRRQQVESRYLASAAAKGRAAKLFFVMASCGLDADVIAAIQSERTAPVGHRGYIWPTLRCYFAYRKPLVSLSVDGRKVVDSQPGYLVIANTREYARGLDPVPEADSTKPLLSARFFPNAGRLFFLKALLSVLFRRSVGAAGSLFFEGREFLLEAEGGRLLQADGELLGEVPCLIVGGVGEVRVLL